MDAIIEKLASRKLGAAITAMLCILWIPGDDITEERYRVILLVAKCACIAAIAITAIIRQAKLDEMNGGISQPDDENIGN